MPRIYELGSFRLDPEAGAVTLRGRPVHLGPRAVAVLTTLVARAGSYVPKRQILEFAWPEVVVEEGNLAVQIAAIRRVLAEEGGERWIETLPRRGYRFVGPVTEAQQDGKTSSRDPHTNLAESSSSFIGRERELAELKRVLPHERLVTIVGVGGIGKTRLALQLAAEVVGAYPDCACFAELGPILDPALVPATVAHALGIQQRAGRPAIDSLCAGLQRRKLLLLLDNCEHLLDASAKLAGAVLAAAPGVTVMATSREPLGVAGEQTYRLNSLSLPDGGSASSGALRRSEAVQLFVERVRKHLPSFELTQDRAVAVAEICIRLDGIPLALELAAARARSLSVEQIRARLEERFRLLTADSRTAVPRQQTLRAALDWSYDLLVEQERIVLRRLSAFPGSFTVEAASAVASDETIDDHAVIDLLSQLASRSLVSVDAPSSGVRYRMLETTRAYAQEKLVETGEADGVRQRHAHHYRGMFEHAPDDWLRLPDREWHALYGPELANIRAALDWAFDGGGDAAVGISLAGSSGLLWAMLGLFAEGLQRLETAIACVGPQTPVCQQAALWLWLGRCVDEAPKRALPAFEKAASLYRSGGDTLARSQVLVRLGRLHSLLGRFKQAEATLREARSLLDEAAPPKVMILYLGILAYLKTLTGELEDARRHYERSLALAHEAGAEFSALATLGSMANIQWALGDLAAAETATRQQLTLLRDSPVATRRLLGYALMNLTGLLTERGALEGALSAMREGLPLVAEDGSAWVFADHVALLAALSGRLRDAALLVGYADATWAAKEASRQPTETHAHDRVHALLRERLAGNELEPLLAEGAVLSEESARRLALHAGDERDA